MVLGEVHGRLAVRRGTRPERRHQALLQVRLLLFDLEPVLLRVALGALHGLLVRVGLAPALLGLLRILRGVVLAEDLEPLLGRQRDTHLLRLHRSFHRRDHLGQPFDPPGQQVVLPPQVFLRVDRRIVEQGHDLFQGEPELAVEQHALQPLQIAGRVPAVPGAAVPAGYQQPDLVVVMQRADANPGQIGHLADRVAHRFPPEARMSPDAT